MSSVVGACFVDITLLIAYFIVSYIKKSVGGEPNEVNRVIKDEGTGNLTQKIDTNYNENILYAGVGG